MPTQPGSPRDRASAELDELRAALRESEQQYQDLFESSIDLIYEHDFQGNFITFNRAAERISGYTREEMIGRNIAEILEPSHLERARAMIARKVEDPDLTTYYELGIRAKDGRLVLLELSTRLLNRNGKPAGIQGVARDITERKQAERTLAEQRARLRAIFETANDAIFVVDEHGRITDANPSTERIFGHSREDLIGRMARTLLSERDAVDVERSIARSLETGNVDLLREREVEAVRRGGETFPLRLFVGECRVEDELELAVFARDLTDVKRAQAALASQARIKSARAELGDRMQRESDPRALAQTVIDLLAEQLQAPVAALHLFDAKAGSFRLTAGHAFDARKADVPECAPGEGLVGQVAAAGRRRTIDQVPDGYLQVRSGLGQSSPAHLLLEPFATKASVKAVAEFGGFAPFSEDALALLDEVNESIAIQLEALQSRLETQRLLTETQRQADELRVQEEELRATNEALADRTQSLEDAQRMLQERAQALSLSNRYKSEFLANMSHELRTPLNSMLLLAQVLERNGEGNLSAKQVEYARTIKKGGDDLLELINDVLDLAKVEAGKAEVSHARLRLEDCAIYVEQTFRAVARDKKLDLQVEVAADAPDSIVTDERRLKQILRNLLSNAFKFTRAGSVCVRFERPASPDELSGSGLTPTDSVAIRVADTGIGIAEAQREAIFEAFLQADGSTSREYGGTGLGLAISREFSELLGGWIRVQSELGRGSVFTLYLPERAAAGAERSAAPQEHVVDDSNRLRAGERSVLVVEDDPSFAKTLLEFSHDQGFKALVARSAEEGCDLARRFRPSAVVLDIGLPGMDGWQMMERLRADPQTRAVAVHVISGREEAAAAAAHGAIGFSSKPVSHDELVSVFQGIRESLDEGRKRLLVVDGDEAERETLRLILSRQGWDVSVAETGEGARRALASERFDGVVLDPSLPDVDGLELLQEIQQSRPAPPKVVVHTGMALSRDDAARIESLSEGTVIKGARSIERLLEEVRLFLRDVESGLPEDVSKRVRHALDRDLDGKKVLVVDDDGASLLAVGRALEAAGVQVRLAEGGRQALEHLERDPDVDVVLMDMMMPEIDGYEAIRRLRRKSRFASLPIIALTAKAMRGDEERCLEAGASDYLSKPVDLDRLVSLLRVWTRRA